MLPLCEWTSYSNTKYSCPAVLVNSNSWLCVTYCCTAIIQLLYILSGASHSCVYSKYERYLSLSSQQYTEAQQQGVEAVVLSGGCGGTLAKQICLLSAPLCHRERIHNSRRHDTVVLRSCLVLEVPDSSTASGRTTDRAKAKERI